MKLNAQNTIELVALIIIVLIVVVSVFMFFGNKNYNMLSMTKINNINAEGFNESSGNSSNVTDNNMPQIVDIETAGSLSNKIANISEAELADAIEKKTVSELYGVKSANDEDVFSLANKLIDELNLGLEHIDTSNLTKNSQKALVEVAIKSKNKLGDSSNATYTMYSAILAKIIYKE